MNESENETPNGKPADDPSEFYAVPADQRLDTDGGEGSDASEGGDDTELLDEVRQAPGQEFETMDRSGT